MHVLLLLFCSCIIAYYIYNMISFTRLVLSVDILSITIPLCERVNWEWNE